MHSPGPADLMAGRHDWILNRLADHRRVLTNELAEQLGVSVDTIRRDLRGLHDQGHLRRVHGGAVQLSPLSPSYSGRAEDTSPERTQLASAIAQRFKPGQVIGLDAGTTTTEIASQLPASLEVTIVTNNPAVAIALTNHQHTSVVLLGGEVDLQWMAATGPTTIDALRGYQLDIAIVGACSFDITAGVTTRSRREVATKQAMIAAAAETLIPMESAKFGTVAPFRIAEASAVGVAIADGAVDEATLKHWRSSGVDITLL